MICQGFPGGSVVKKICLPCRTHKFDPLEKEMATHSSIFAWRIPSTEELERLHSMGSLKESDMMEHTHTHSTCPPENTHLSISSLHLFPVS